MALILLEDELEGNPTGQWTLDETGGGAVGGRRRKEWLSLWLSFVAFLQSKTRRRCKETDRRLELEARC